MAGRGHRKMTLDPAVGNMKASRGAAGGVKHIAARLAGATLDVDECVEVFPSAESRSVGPAELQVICCSANVGNQMPTPISLASWIPENGEVNGAKLDIVAIGMQESVYKVDKPEDSDSSSDSDDEDAAVTTHKKRTGIGTIISDKLAGECTEHLETMMKSCLGDEYSIIRSVRRLEMRLYIFVHNKHKSNVSQIEVDTENSGLGGVVANKGGQAIKLELYGTTLCFVSSHLEAHRGGKHLERRNSSVREILKGIRFGDRKYDLASQFPFVFWMGDLNYRLDIKSLSEYKHDFGIGWEEKLVHLEKRWKEQDKTMDPQEVKRWAKLDPKFRAEWEEVQSLIEKLDLDDTSRSSAISTLLKADELEKAIAKNEVFAGWTALKPDFKPTFKVLRPPDTRVSESQPLGYLEKRISSYCDRILWRALPGCARAISVSNFEACERYLTSDHKPVRATFSIKLDWEDTLDEDGPDFELTFSDLKASIPATTSDVPDSFVEFDSYPEDLLHPLTNTGESTKVMKTTTKWNNVSPSWDGEHPTARIRRKILARSRTPHVLICLRDKDFLTSSDTLGCCAIPFDGILNMLGRRVNFSEPLIKYGQQVGSISGVVKMSEKR